jgi:ATP-binding cassette subfamily B protein
MSDAKRYGDRQLLIRLFGEARSHAGSMTLLFVVSLIGAPLALLLPVPIKIVVDHVLGSEPFPPLLSRVLPASLEADPTGLLVVCAVAVVVIAVLVQAQAMAAWLLETWIGQRLMVEFRRRLFDHLQLLGLGFHARRGTADSIYRLQFDATSIQSVAVQGAIPFATALVKVLVLVVAVARLDWVLAAVALLGGPLLFGLTELFRRGLRRRWAAVREHESAAMSVAQEALQALEVVKAFGQERRETQRYLARAHAGVSAAVKAVFSHGAFDLLVGITNGVAAAVILYLGARHVQTGIITLGELVMILAYLSQLFMPLREIGTRVATMQQALASAARVFSVLDERPDVTERPGAASLDRARGAFSFEDVAFAYPGTTREIFRGVDLHIPEGARVGVVGRTGSGKSTLLSLLPRFYDPTGGRVLLDGTDLRDLCLADLRRQFAIVLQDNVLFSATVRENVAYGRPGASEEEIRAALEAAAADFVDTLSHGLDTEVGENGTTLSGGERQRIALARAFLCDAPVLILDEPTSSLDAGTESEVMDAVERLMEGRTVFIIAHRVHTLEACDVRLRVAEGRVTRIEDLSGLDDEEAR